MWAAQIVRDGERAMQNEMQEVLTRHNGVREHGARFPGVFPVEMKLMKVFKSQSDMIGPPHF